MKQLNNEWEQIEKDTIKCVKRIQKAAKNNKSVKLSNEECRNLCLTFLDNIDREDDNEN